MRQKIDRKIMFATAVLYFLLFGIVVGLYCFNHKLSNYHNYIILLAFLIAVIGSILLNKYENIIDKKYIENMVSQGKIALVSINKVEKGKTIRTLLSPSKVYYKLNVTLYNSQSGNKHNTEFVDLFSSKQETFPDGFFYVTYDGKDDNILVVPNVIVSLYKINQKTVESYEKSINKLVYLNVYYDNGIIIEAFEKTIKRINK